MSKKKCDKLVIGFSIIAIIVLALVVVNVDRIFPSPEAPSPMKYASQSGAITLDIGGDNPDAPVTIIEFSGFQCSWCQKVAPTVERIVSEYGGQINFVFKHMAGYPGSQIMAEAAECAKEQGKFWEYHHLLFERGVQSDSSLADYAQELGLDTDKFDACMLNRRMTLKIENDFKEALSIGVEGTPTFIINGQMYPGALDYERFKSIIEEELAKNE